MNKDLNHLYIAVVGVVALFLAFSCNAQGFALAHHDSLSIKYSAPPTLEKVQINGRWCYVETWPYIEAEYITYSFNARHFTGDRMPIYSSIADTTINDVVTRVRDGDSYYLKGLADFVRIAGVDAPEIYWGPGTKDQDFGRAIGDSVRLALKGKSATYAFLGMDELKRPLVIVYVDGKDFAETLLSKGWAWSYGTKNLPMAVNKRYKSLMNEAKKKKLGLWKGKSPVKPWVHRSQYRRIWSK